MPSAAFCMVYRYRYTMPICSAVYGLSMRSVCMDKKIAAPDRSGAVAIICNIPANNPNQKDSRRDRFPTYQTPVRVFALRA